MKIARCVLYGLLLMWISACHGGNTVSTTLVGYNHTDKDVGHFTVDGNEGGFLQAHRGGGKFVCCISVPDPWRPGVKVKVGWTDDYDENYQERVVEIPKYDAKRTGQFSVHFLRNGEIKVFVPLGGLGGPDYPLKGPEAGLYAGEDPVEVWKHGRKGDQK
ncbi:DUF3304 domain-containing protein [Xanthomonas oryzae pv. oryzicola]|uniref:DUF3304 domain-containing protein n=1 Tax=Xanthomonas oryzae TaxID=347 RepID=UPI003132ECCC